MRYILLCAIPLLLGIGLAHAQSISGISVEVAQDVYSPGDTVQVHGVLHKMHGGAVTIQLLSPNGNIIAVGQVMPTERDWQWSIPAEFDTPGTYTVQAEYSLTKHTIHYATDVFSYTVYQQGEVLVNGTEHLIQYTGDAIHDAYTDGDASLLYIEFEGPGSGVMFLPPGLVQGELLAVDGGAITHIDGGQYAYSVDSNILVLTADAVAIPEFGAAMWIFGVGAMAAGMMAQSRLRLPR